MLLNVQRAAIAARFRHFDPELCAGLFSQDQEDGGLFTVAGQGQFPGVRMANDAVWYYDRGRRPRRVTPGGRDTGPMKSQAPPGARRLLCSNPAAQELVLVEGEGHALALTSIKIDGVVCCGGVNVFHSRAGWATEALARLAGGKRVRIAFDPDAAGQRAAREVAARLLEVGATRVAILPPQENWPKGADVEDWIASFDSPEAAYHALATRLANLPWLDQATQAAEEAQPELFVRTTRIPQPNQPLPAVAVSTWDEEAKQLGLAVMWLPHDEQEAPNESVRHDAEPAEREGLGRGWATAESWLYDGHRYVPDDRGGMLTHVARRTAVPPAPPAEDYGTSESLWADVKAFLKQWLALRRDEQYDVLVAYVFMTYRLFDAQFPHVPYLRFHGPPASGKGRALACMKQLSCWSFDGQPTSDNLHRVVEYFGEITLIIDEFHLDRGTSREAQERIIDTLNLGNDKEKSKLRVNTAGSEMVVEAFSMFGAKVFAGYGYDEHEGLARRTVNVDMTGIDVPEHMDTFALPERFYSNAYVLRRRLMAWRGAKYALGLPDPEGERARRLRKAAGREVGQVFWPLLEMVPESLPRAQAAVVEAAQGRRAETHASRGVSDDSYLLEQLSQMRPLEGNFYATSELAELAGVDPAHVARRLKKLGFQHRRIRVGFGNPRGGFELTNSPDERAIFERYGVTHPADKATTKKQEDPL